MCIRPGRREILLFIIKDGNYDVILMATSYWSLTTWYAISEAKRRHVPMVTRMTVEVDRKRNGFIRAIKKIIVCRYCKKMSAGETV